MTELVRITKKVLQEGREKFWVGIPRFNTKARLLTWENCLRFSRRVVSQMDESSIPPPPVCVWEFHEHE